MQMNRQIVIILILASLLFSALGAAFYFYKLNKASQRAKNEMVTIFIAKNNIEKNTLINIKHLAKTQIAKQYLLNKPLVKEEIIGKYTKEKIYKNEMFLKEKLNSKIQRKRSKLLDFEHSSYNMKFSLFQNANISLNQGDLINIITVYPKANSMNSRGEYSDYKVQYIAKAIRVLGFIRDGRVESQTITKQKIKKKIKKKMIEETVDVKADEIILDIKNEVILKLIKDLNKGNQIWMVKTKETPLEASLDELKTNSVKKVKKVAKKRVYKYRWYKSKNVKVSKKALISYESEKTSESKTVDYTLKANFLCSKIKTNLLLGEKNSYNLRTKASKDSKIVRVLGKKLIIPYIRKEGSWYLTCDRNYLHESVVKEIPYLKAKNLVGAR